MALKIFITGATGYIGGDTLYALYRAHPDYSYAALVRTEEKAKPVKEAFPNVDIVIGGLDDSAIIEEQAAKADVVIHTADASDHEGAAHAIARGLATHSASSPGYWLHTGGAGILCWETQRSDARLGEHSDREYNDWTAVHDLTHLPSDAFHKNVDDIVLSAGSEKVKTAILCPPTIFGRGRGPGNARSRQAYELANVVLTQRCVPVVGKGEARWNNVHVADLADVFVKLVEVIADSSARGDKDAELWNDKGYYLVEAGEHKWTDLARLMAKRAVELGLVERKEELKDRVLEKQEALDVAGFEAVSWGFNSRGKAERARKLLGWKPERGGIEAWVDQILADEKARL